MFRRQLDALGYPTTAEELNAKDEKQLQRLVIWLEDQKIRHYKIEDRADLRDTSSSSHWSQAWEQYLKDLDCPFEWEETNLVIDWLLTFAVRLEFEDQAPKYGEVAGDEVQTMVKGPQVVQSNPLDNLDFDSEEFRGGVAQLANLLKVPNHPDHLVTLKALSVLVRSKLSGDALNSATKSQPLVKKRGRSYTIDETTLGFETGDKVLNRAAKVLRLLHINDLRELQTVINRVIVMVQAITANPKTDTSLGQVGMK